MKKLLISFLFSMLATTQVMALEETSSQPTILAESAAIQKLMSAVGSYDAHDKNFKITVPRDDLNITINGIKIASAMGLTSWITFKKLDDFNTSMHANLVLTEDQINTVMQTAIDNHLNVTELHNHLMWESPKVMFMHVEGTGNTNVLAMSMAKVMDKVKETSNGQGDFPLGEVDATTTTFDQTKIERILGARGELKDGVYRIVVDRHARNAAPDVNPFMPRTNTKAIFAGSSETAVVDGNLAMQQANLQKVLTALHKAGISIVAIHERHINDKTTYVFLHYWGIGRPTDLARGIRTALDISQLPDELPAVTANRLLRSALRATYFYVPTHKITVLSNYCNSNFCSSSQKLFMRQNLS